MRCEANILKRVEDNRDFIVKEFTDKLETTRTDVLMDVGKEIVSKDRLSLHLRLMQNMQGAPTSPTPAKWL